MVQIQRRGPAADSYFLDQRDFQQWESLLTDDIYKKLLKCAKPMVRDAKPNFRDEPDDLLNQTLLRLMRSSSPIRFIDKKHFCAVVVNAMDHSLIDTIRSVKTFKRGQHYVAVELENDIVFRHDSVPEILAVHQILNQLKGRKGRPALVLEMHAIHCDSLEDIATSLSLSVRTVKRDLATARDWVSAEMELHRKVA